METVLDKVQKIYDTHKVFLNNMKENRGKDQDTMPDGEMRLLDEMITSLAGVLGDLYRNILSPDVKISLGINISITIFSRVVTMKKGTEYLTTSFITKVVTNGVEQVCDEASFDGWIEDKKGEGWEKATDANLNNEVKFSV